MKHEDFISENNDKILVGIDSIVARKFFTEITSEDAIKLANGNLLWERYSIKLLILLDFICAMLSIVFSVISLSWYSLLFIPFFMVSWFKYKIRASYARQNINNLILLAVFVIAPFLFFVRENLMIVLLGIFATLTFLFSKLIYTTSVSNLRNAAFKYPNIYYLLLGTGIFIRQK